MPTDSVSARTRSTRKLERSIRVVGKVRIPVRGPDAFVLFTPRGERAWADHWDPLFATPTTDDSAPGTVFEIAHDSVRVTWIVCHCEPGRTIRYARFLPGDHAGTIEVSLSEDGEGSIATVEYHLTALTAKAARHLHRFAARYTDFLREWEIAITASLEETDGTS